MKAIVTLFILIFSLSVNAQRPINFIKDSLTNAMLDAVNEARVNPYEFVKKYSLEVKSNPSILDKIELSKDSLTGLSVLKLDQKMCSDAKRYAEELVNWSDGTVLAHLNGSTYTATYTKYIFRKNNLGYTIKEKDGTITSSTSFKYTGGGQDNLAIVPFKGKNVDVKAIVAQFLVDNILEDYKGDKIGHRKSVLYKENTKMGFYVKDCKYSNRSVVVLIFDGILLEGE